ncbi:LOW QUALITY PROTEIN: uncharacterized protein [Leptinotarsa decemlineata]|uniref:LOW QUALITY PROTEIN: uncharacterized protein n=1 Tax=Leptinotarsa decemlineata TaxID=7539 RepID=UPI003D3080AD
MKKPRTFVVLAATCLLVGEILAEQNSSNKHDRKKNSRLSRQTSADQMVQNILQWLQGVYTQQNRRIRQGGLREYLPPTITEKPRPFQPRPNGDGTDESGNFIDGGYPPVSTPQPPFPYPSGPTQPPVTQTPGYPTVPAGLSTPPPPSPPSGFQTQPPSGVTSYPTEGPSRIPPRSKRRNDQDTPTHRNLHLASQFPRLPHRRTFPYPPSIETTERPGYPTPPQPPSSVTGYPSEGPSPYPPSIETTERPGFPTPPQPPSSFPGYPTEGPFPYPPSLETTERPGYPTSPQPPSSFPGYPTEGPSPYPPSIETMERPGYPTPPQPPSSVTGYPTEGPSPYPPSLETTERPGYSTPPPLETERPSVPGIFTPSPYIPPQEPTGFSTPGSEAPEVSPEYPEVPTQPPPGVSPTFPPQEVVTEFLGFPTASPPGVTPGSPTESPPEVTPGFPTALPPGITPGYPTVGPPGVTPGFPTASPRGLHLVFPLLLLRSNAWFPHRITPRSNPRFSHGPTSRSYTRYSHRVAPEGTPGYPTATPGFPTRPPTGYPTSPGDVSGPTSPPEFTSPPGTYVPGKTEPEVIDDDLRHPPHIHAIDVECGKEMMTINLEFNRVFDGVIYSKGYFNMPECRYVNENSGQTKYTFTVNLNMCGTEFINAFDTLGKSYLENVLVIQNEAGIQEIWDTIRSVRCLWEGNLKEQLSVSLMVGMLTQEIVTFSGDTAMAKLDIQLGRGPFGQPATGLVKIGEPMTLVVSVSGDPGFDIQVKDCRATDSTGANIVPLTDDNGCVLKPKLFGAFQKTRNTGNTGATIIAFAYFNAFKFPDVMDIMIECNIELCKTDCEMCPNPDQALEPAKRRKRDLYSFNATLHDGVMMGKHLRVVLPEDLAERTVVNDSVCLSTQNFVFSSSVLISLLTASCLFSAYLWLKSHRQKVVKF